MGPARAVLLLIAMLATAKERTMYTPLACMSDFTIVDFGKCTSLANGRKDCPAAHINFGIACVSTKPGPLSETITIKRPAAYQEEK